MKQVQDSQVFLFRWPKYLSSYHSSGFTHLKWGYLPEHLLNTDWCFLMLSKIQGGLEIAWKCAETTTIQYTFCKKQK